MEPDASSTLSGAGRHGGSSDGPPAIRYRSATLEDALPLSVLASQVFLDTYATNGVNRDLAMEASTVYGVEIFRRRLTTTSVEVTLATRGEYLVGFVDLDTSTTCPVSSVQGPEILRLYVQAPFQRLGIGRSLLDLAERRAVELGADQVWLTAWVGNARALAFYPAVGYRDVGTTQYVIEGKEYENRVFAKRTAATEA